MDRPLREKELRVLHGLIDHAEERLGHHLSRPMADFLAHALLRHMRTSWRINEEYFADNLAYYRSVAEGKVAEPVLLQNVGDSALLLAGFMPRHSHRTTVSPVYYIQVGQGAYANLADHNRVFDWNEAARQFTRLVDVLLSMPAEDQLDAWTADLLRQFSITARRYLAVRGIGPGSIWMQ